MELGTQWLWEGDRGDEQGNDCQVIPQEVTFGIEL